MKSRYYLDTEFIEAGRHSPVQLISIGIASEDGREFYAESQEFDPKAVSPWLKENVLPHLGPVENRKPVAVIAKEVRKFIGDGKPEFWGYYADYDWVVFCQMFGSMIDLPEGWPMYCRDIKQLCDSMGNPELPPNDGAEHNALSDAKWNEKALQFLLSEHRVSSHALGASSENSPTPIKQNSSDEEAARLLALNCFHEMKANRRNLGLLWDTYMHSGNPEAILQIHFLAALRRVKAGQEEEERKGNLGKPDAPADHVSAVLQNARYHEALRKISGLYGQLIPFENREDFLNNQVRQAHEIAEEALLSSQGVGEQQELENEALPASTQANVATQKKYSSASAAIYDFEQSLVDAIKLVRLAHSSVSRTFEGDGGSAHPSLGLMEISQRALNQANDAARYARHALSAVVPRP